MKKLITTILGSGTYVYPKCDGVDIKTQCRLTYDGPLILAKDLLTVD